MQELRNKRGIGYSPQAGYSSLRGKAMYNLAVPGLRPAQIPEAIDVMNNIIKDLKESLVPEKIFEGKKVQFLSSYQGHLESPDSRAKE